MFLYEEIVLLKKIAEYFKDINKHPLAEIITNEFNKEVANFPNFKEPEFVNDNLKTIFNKHFRLKKRQSDCRDKSNQKSAQKNKIVTNDAIHTTSQEKENIENILPILSEVNGAKESFVKPFSIVPNKANNIRNEAASELDSSENNIEFNEPVTSTPIANKAQENICSMFPDQSNIETENVIEMDYEDDGMGFSAINDDNDNIVIENNNKMYDQHIYNAKTLCLDDGSQFMDTDDEYEKYFHKSQVEVKTEPELIITDDNGNHNIMETDLLEPVFKESKVKNQNIEKKGSNNLVENQEEIIVIEDEEVIAEKVPEIFSAVPVKHYCEIATQCNEEEINCVITGNKRHSEGKDDFKSEAKRRLLDVDLDNDDDENAIEPEDLFQSDSVQSSQDLFAGDNSLGHRKRQGSESSISTIHEEEKEIVLELIKPKKIPRLSIKALNPFKGNKKSDIEKRILMSDGWLLWPRALLSGCLKNYAIDDFREVLEQYNDGGDYGNIESRCDLLNLCLKHMSNQKLILKGTCSVKEIDYYIKLGTIPCTTLDNYEIDFELYKNILWNKSSGPKAARKICAQVAPANVYDLLQFELDFVEDLMKNASKKTVSNDEDR